jgi:Domain of unknown function (DUF1906)
MSRRRFAKSSIAVAATLGGLRDVGAQSSDDRGDTKDVLVKDILGVHCVSYPGDDVVDKLRKFHYIRIMGFYLSHSDTKLDASWSKEVRKRLANKAWGFFPIYNGTQDVRPSRNQAVHDAGQAADLMSKMGFAAGSVVYLDIENGHDEKDPYGQYVKIWMAALRGLNFYPGAYSVYPNASWLTKLSSAVWTAELPQVQTESRDSQTGQSFRNNASPQQLFDAGILSYDPSKDPHGKIRDGCVATHYAREQIISDVGAAANVRFDLDWSKAADPSNTACIAEAIQLRDLI